MDAQYQQTNVYLQIASYVFNTYYK